MDRPPSVLIVDSSEETREVLQTALERRGMRTLLAADAKPGIAMARRHRPDLIVLDLEIDHSDCEDIAEPFTTELGEKQPPMVLLGSVRRNQLGHPHEEFVSKPYHYGPLVRKIEQILQNARGTVAPTP